MEYPRSRVRIVHAQLYAAQKDPWTIQAIAADGTSAYDNWAQLSRNIIPAVGGDPNIYRNYISDGELAGGGNNQQTGHLPGHAGNSYVGMDAVSNSWEWPTTPVQEGQLDMRFITSASHDPSFFHVWITKSTYNHRAPMTWDDLEYLGRPPHTRTGDSYYFSVNLPARTGHHVIYCLWQRDDPAGEVFISTSDVTFGGVSNEPPTLSLTTPVTVQESAGNASVIATLSSQPLPGTTVTASYTTTAGTAGSADFTAQTGTISFSGARTQQTISIPIINDTEAESDEVFTVKLSNITNAAAGNLTSTVTIKDNDGVAGGGGYYVYTPVSSWSTGSEGTLEIFYDGPAALTDWTVTFDATFTLTAVYNAVLQAGSSMPYILEPPSWDPPIYPNTAYTISWLSGTSNPAPPSNVRLNGQLLSQSAPAVFIEPVTQPEGDGAGTVNLTVSLQRAYTAPIHVSFATLDGSAKAGTDYTSTTGTLVFAAGDTSKTITIDIQGDTEFGPSKAFTVSLAGVNGQTPPRFVTGKQSALVTLTNDDAPPPSLLVTGDSLLEGNSGTRDATFRLRLSRAPKAGETFSLNYETAAGTATPGVDFTPRNGTVNFAVGATEATVTVPILGDTADERLELFYLLLNTPVGFSLINTSATGQIVDDDTPAGAFGNQRLVAYLDMTTGSSTLPPADRLTHIMAAFANVNTDGTLALPATTPALSTWKAALPGVKILLSIGGWNWSEHFPAVADSETKRNAFAASCRQHVQTYNLDGIDLDWEWPGGGNTIPNPNDRNNFTLLVQAVRAALDDLSQTTGKSYELTCYAPASNGNIGWWDLAVLKNYFDFFNVQGYDLHGTWDNQTNHQSALYPNPSGPADGLTISEILGVYEAAGVPRSQVLVGAPFYGQVWNNAGPTQNGLFQSATGSGTPTYATLVTGSTRNHLRVWDNYSKVPYLYDALGTGQFTSYDDPQALLEKANFSKAEGYAGVYFWQSGGDTADRQLLIALSDSLALPPHPDSDADGLLDAWEIQYYGNITKVNAGSDTDGDGTNSMLEMLAKTDPTNRLSVLRVGLHDPGSHHTVVGFDSQIGVTYLIERSFDLGEWDPLFEDVAGDGNHLHLHDMTLPEGATQAYYRITPLP
jgi:GH18 family chitinase/predicted carbohydrate-binding protein with CBM5 and CBM33 domain